MALMVSTPGQNVHLVVLPFHLMSTKQDDYMYVTETHEAADGFSYNPYCLFDTFQNLGSKVLDF